MHGNCCKGGRLSIFRTILIDTYQVGETGTMTNKAQAAVEAIQWALRENVSITFNVEETYFYVAFKVTSGGSKLESKKSGYADKNAIVDDMLDAFAQAHIEFRSLYAGTMTMKAQLAPPMPDEHHGGDDKPYSRDEVELRAAGAAEPIDAEYTEVKKDDDDIPY
jgi:hypothetical protein